MRFMTLLTAAGESSRHASHGSRIDRPRVVDSRTDGRMRAVSDQRYDTAMPKSAGRRWQYHVGLSGLMLVILVILLLTGNLKQAPPLIAPGLDFNTSQPATRR